MTLFANQSRARGVITTDTSVNNVTSSTALQRHDPSVFAGSLRRYLIKGMSISGGSSGPYLHGAGMRVHSDPRTAGYPPCANVGTSWQVSRWLHSIPRLLIVRASTWRSAIIPPRAIARHGDAVARAYSTFLPTQGLAGRTNSRGTFKDISDTRCRSTMVSMHFAPSMGKFHIANALPVTLTWLISETCACALALQNPVSSPACYSLSCTFKL